MRIVVTGAAGFVGSCLSAAAVEHGHEVFALDNLSRGRNPIAQHPGVTFMAWDCLHGLPADVDGADAVVHFAAGTGSLERPIDELRKMNVEMTKEVYRAAMKAGVRVMAFPTTSLALGVPDSPYVISKEEAMAWLMREADPHKVLPLRFFNVTGAYAGAFSELRLNEVHILPTMVDCYVQKKPFRIQGKDYPTRDGTPSRDFVHVADVVQYVLHLLESCVAEEPKPVDKHRDGAIWCGTGRTTTVLELVNLFRARVGWLNTEFVSRRAFDVGEIRCDSLQALQMEHVLGRKFLSMTAAVESEVSVLMRQTVDA